MSVVLSGFSTVKVRISDTGEYNGSDDSAGCIAP